MKIGVYLAAGVLLVVTAPLVAANLEGPKVYTDPGVQQAQDMADKTKKQVEEEAQRAQDEAGKAQKEAEALADELEAETARTRQYALDQADEAQASVVGAFDNFVASAQRVVEQALRCVMYAVDSTQVCETKPRDGSAPGDDEATFTAESTTAVPVDGTAVAGYAMVVVAGAVGGALLWWTVLQRSFVLGVLPLLSRISHSEIYTNDARRLIAQIATQNPGLCLNEIVARTGYSRNAVSYHLFVLEKEAEIVSIKDGKYRRYFPRGGKYVNGAKNVVSALRNETTLKMAQHIVANPGTIQRDLCQLLGTTASAACWHAKRLEQLGVIRKQRVANTVKYFPGEALDKHDYSDFGLATARAEPAPVAPLPSSMPGLPA